MSVVRRGSRRASATLDVGGNGLRIAVFAYVGVLIVLPLLEITRRGIGGGLDTWRAVLADSVALDAVKTSLITAAIAAVVNGTLGTLTAWALVRWRFPGRRMLAALVDLPLAVPTLLAGLMLVVLYGPGTWIGARFEIVFAAPGIVLALLFVTFPLTVRAVEPVLRDFDPAEEEAARTLGASPWTTVWRVILPALLPAIATGTAQSFARGLAEFGSLIVVSGNMPGKTMTAPVFVFGEVEAGHLDAAAAVSIVLLAMAMLTSYMTRSVVRMYQGAHAG